MLSREEAKQKAVSRDCSCILGKDRDNNYNEVIDEVYSSLSSMICSNCSTPNRNDYYSAIDTSINTTPNFGCNEFERKTDGT